MEEEPTPSAGPMILYSAWYCPFAQRAWMALLHKGVAFDYTEVDPYQTQGWWLDVSRGQGKVPVLVAPRLDGDGQITVIDSTRVVEYLDERLPGAEPLFPPTPDARAETRFWIDHVNERIVPHIYRFLDTRQPRDESNDARDRLIAGVRALSEAMSPRGPCFSGPDLGVIDLLMIPFAYRIEALLGYYRAFTLPDAGAAWSRYRRWYEAVCDTEIFRATATDHRDYRKRLVAHYLPYSQGQGQQDVKQASN